MEFNTNFTYFMFCFTVLLEKKRKDRPREPQPTTERDTPFRGLADSFTLIFSALFDRERLLDQEVWNIALLSPTVSKCNDEWRFSTNHRISLRYVVGNVKFQNCLKYAVLPHALVVKKSYVSCRNKYGVRNINKSLEFKEILTKSIWLHNSSWKCLIWWPLLRKSVNFNSSFIQGTIYSTLDRSTYGSTVLSLDFSCFFSFLLLYTVGRTTWTGESVAKPLPTHKTTKTQNKRTQKSMNWVGFEPMIPPFERMKTVYALDRAVTVIATLDRRKLNKIHSTFIVYAIIQNSIEIHSVLEMTFQRMNKFGVLIIYPFTSVCVKGP
jgi:hypothetical protein